ARCGRACPRKYRERRPVPWPVRTAGMRRDPALSRRPQSRREDNEIARCFAIPERLKDDIVAALRLGRAVPRAVKRPKGAALITAGEGLAGVDQKIVRRPMTRKSRHRPLPLRAPAHGLAIAAIFRRLHKLPLCLIVIALRPAVV